MSYIPVIDSTRLAADSVNSSKVADGTLVNADISASAAIAFSKLEAVPWHAGNDGAGSGLDADLLDAQSSAYYLSRTNHTGTQTASTISDFDTQVQSNSIDELQDAAADVGMGGFKITSLGTPTAAGDAVNKSYVDAIATGLVDYKASVRAVATSTITLSGLQTIDGVSLADGDRVLYAPGAASAAGLYTASAGAWTRTPDADTSSEVTAGMYLAVEEGTNYADSVWLLATDNPITLDTTALTFIELPSIQDLIAGAGLTKTGNTVDVGAGTGITVNANDVAIDTAVVPRKGVANTFTAEQTMQARLVTQAGVRVFIQTFAADHTFDPTADHFMVMDSAAAVRTVTLPSSHAAGDHLYVKRNGANSVVIATNDSDTIDGSASDVTLTQDQETALIVSDGTNWHRF
jgi:hypothetical protein